MLTVLSKMYPNWGNFFSQLGTKIFSAGKGVFLCLGGEKVRTDDDVYGMDVKNLFRYKYSLTL